MADELYEVRNSLVLGNYHQAIAEGTGAKSHSKKPDEVQQFNTERDALVALAQVGLGQWDMVLNDLRNAAAPLLVGVRHWASLHKALAAGDAGDAAFAELSATAGETPASAQAPVAVLVAAAATLRNETSTALKVASTWAAALKEEQNPRVVIQLRAIAVDSLLRMHRVDLAERELNAMKNIDDDAVQCLISAIAVHLEAGAAKPDRYRDAETLINEVVGRCGQSVSMLNLLALAKLGQGKPQEAEQHLLDALSKRSADAETLANLAVCAAQLGKPQEATLRFVSQAKATGPHAVWSKQYAAMEQRFADAVIATGATA